LARALLLWGFALPGHLHAFGMPDAPLFGFSQASHEMERLIGPLVAVLARAGLVMLLRFTIDAPPSGETFLRAVRPGFKDVFRTDRRSAQAAKSAQAPGGAHALCRRLSYPDHL
jgi:hypothetical protein